MKTCILNFKEARSSCPASCPAGCRAGCPASGALDAQQALRARCGDPVAAGDLREDQPAGQAARSAYTVSVGSTLRRRLKE